MAYYVPELIKIVYVYDRRLKIICIRSKVRVYLKAGDSLTLTGNYYDAATKEVKIGFDHIKSDALNMPVLFESESTSNYIIDPVTVPPYDQTNEQAFKDAVARVLSAGYKVSAKVKEEPGVAGSGGQVTNTISNSGEIIIV